MSSSRLSSKPSTCLAWDGWVSLSAVEAAVRAVVDDPDIPLMAVSLPDANKGERIVLLSEAALDAKTLKTALRSHGSLGGHDLCGAF